MKFKKLFRKANTTFILSFIVWSIFGIVLFGMASSLIFKLIYTPEVKASQAFSEIVEDLKSMEDGDIRSYTSTIPFMESALFFTNLSGDVGIELNRKKATLSMSQSCENGESCVCIFADFKEIEDKNYIPSVTFCEPLESKFYRNNVTHLFFDFYTTVSSSDRGGDFARNFGVSSNLTKNMLLVDRFSVLPGRYSAFGFDYSTGDRTAKINFVGETAALAVMGLYFVPVVGEFAAAVAGIVAIVDYIHENEYEKAFELLKESPNIFFYIGKTKNTFVFCLDKEYCQMQMDEINPPFSALDPSYSVRYP